MIFSIDSSVKKPSPNFELSKQELYVRVEAPKGEFGIFLIGDHNVFPWRWQIILLFNSYIWNPLPLSLDLNI